LSAGAVAAIAVCVVASVISAVVPANGATLIAHATAPAITLERIDLAMHVLLIIVLPVRMTPDRHARRIARTAGVEAGVKHDS
jgi:threonine/homoserine efflux transporter RhtA